MSTWRANRSVLTSVVLAVDRSSWSYPLYRTLMTDSTRLVRDFSDMIQRARRPFHDGTVSGSLIIATHFAEQLLAALQSSQQDPKRLELDAERWRAVRESLYACSVGPTDGYYMTTGDFVGAPMPSADEYADLLIAKAQRKAAASHPIPPQEPPYT